MTPLVKMGGNENLPAAAGAENGGAAGTRASCESPGRLILPHERDGRTALIKLFACDLDGTLYNALHETDRAILTCIERAIAAGRHVAVATGRWSHSASELGFGELPMEVVCGNGAFVYGPGARLMRHVPIDPATLEELLDTFPTCCFTCIAPDGTFVRGTRDQHSAGYLAPSGLLGPLIARRMRRGLHSESFVFGQTTSDILSHEVCKVNCRVADPALEAEVDAFVSEHAGTLVNASFDGSLFEITAAGVDKGEAVAWLAARLGYAEDEVAVYGDGGNDLVMLERFEHAYATRGGSEAAKRAAGNVIGSCAFHAVPRHIMATIRREGPLAQDEG